MSNVIMGNMVGAYSQLGKTIIIQDEEGEEVTGVIVAQEAVFTATPEDVRFNKTFANDEGIQVGTQHMPQYTYAIVGSDSICIDMCGTFLSHDGEEGYISVPSYDPSYVGKYYNTADGKWY